ncbi:MAG TPA: tetratricopeptide repeat protein, partial [Saprospiraceae bacterium]|nr:tetratricopeptide repeat protein [Saprospiraceae bacterium]
MLTKTETVHTLENLEQSLSGQQDIVEKLRLLSQIAQYYIYTDIHKAQHFLEEQRIIFDKVDNPSFYLQYLIQSAIAENHLYNYTFADSVFNKAIQLAESLLEPVPLAELYIDYIGTCLNLNSFDTATEYINKTYKLFDRFPNKRLAARLLVREGFYQLLQSNYPKAIELLNQAENALMALPQPLSIKDKFFLSLIFSGLGTIYDKTSENKKATTAYSQVVSLCEESGITTRLAWHYLNLGNCYLNADIIAKAALHFSKAIQCKDDISRKARAAAFANLGYCDFMQEKYDTALSYYDKAEALYNEIAPGELSNFSVIQNYRAKLYARKGDQVNA